MSGFERFLTRVKALLRAWRQRRAEQHAWSAITAKHHDHWLEDAGISPDERHRLAEKRRLDAIGRWSGSREGWF